MTPDHSASIAHELLARAQACLEGTAPPDIDPCEPACPMAGDARAVFDALHALRVHGGHAPLPCTIGCRHALIDELGTLPWAAPIAGGLASAARAVAAAYDLTGVLSPTLAWRSAAETITRSAAETIVAAVARHLTTQPPAPPASEPAWEITSLMRWADALWAGPPWDSPEPDPTGTAWRRALADSGRAVLHRLHVLHLLAGGVALPSSEGARDWLRLTRLPTLIEVGLVEPAWLEGILDAANLLDDTESDTCWATAAEARAFWEQAHETDRRLREAVETHSRRRAERGGVSPPIDDVFWAMGKPPLEATHARLAVDIRIQHGRLRPAAPTAGTSPRPADTSQPPAEGLFEALAHAVRDGLWIDVRLSDTARGKPVTEQPSDPDTATPTTEPSR